MKIKKLEIGDTFYSCDGYKNHIIDFVVDGDERLVVYKFWLPHKKRWGYLCQLLDVVLFDICLRHKLDQKKREKLFIINGIDYNFNNND